MAAWHTTDSIRTSWRDADTIDDDDLLEEYLEVARDAVVAYAPALADNAEVPVRYRLAQMIHVKNMWNAARATPQSPDDPTFQLGTHPLDWHVKQILRPERGVPRFG